MPSVGPEAFKLTPRWYQEIVLGIGFLLFAMIAAYPWRGSVSFGSVVLAATLGGIGVTILVHGVRLGKRTHWRWISKCDREKWLKETAPGRRSRVIVTIVTFILGVSVLSSVDLSGATLGLRPGGWLGIAGGVAIAVIAYVGLQRVFASSRLCSNCRRMIGSDATTCPFCGSSFTEDATKRR